MNDARTKPVGLRDALAKKFIDTLTADFDRNCTTVIETLREDKVYDYLRIVVSLLPKEIVVDDSQLEEMPNDELAAVLTAVRSLIAARHAAPPAEGDGAEDGDGAARHES
jgi:hypothetical protein